MMTTSKEMYPSRVLATYCLTCNEEEDTNETGHCHTASLTVKGKVRNDTGIVYILKSKTIVAINTVRSTKETMISNTHKAYNYTPYQMKFMSLHLIYHREFQEILIYLSFGIVFVMHDTTHSPETIIYKHKLCCSY